MPWAVARQVHSARVLRVQDARSLGQGPPEAKPPVGEGDGLVRLARLTAFTDFASTYLAIARGVDPTPIRTLDRVKAALSGAVR
jgi:hypothetical protein